MGKQPDIPQEKQMEIKTWESSGPNLGFKHSHGADWAGICLGKFPLDSNKTGCAGKGGQRGKSIGKQSFPPKKLLPKGFHGFEDEAGMEFPTPHFPLHLQLPWIFQEIILRQGKDFGRTCHWMNENPWKNPFPSAAEHRERNTGIETPGMPRRPSDPSRQSQQQFPG